jgi:hypothetical protein
MPSTQELLNLITGMQQQAQSNLPVIPNNGNPNGVYNNPRAAQPNELPMRRRFSGEHMYPWLNPSPSMGNIWELLSKPLIPPRMGFGNETMTPMPQPEQKPIPDPRVGFGNETMTPITKPVPNPTMGFGNETMVPLPQRPVPQDRLERQQPSYVNPMMPNLKLPIRAY